MDEAEFALASGCYGYGRWDAPYWFIGPEQGQDRGEGNQLTVRHQAFKNLSRDGLSDCRKFHALIEQRKWHRDERPPLQRTWRRLMLLLAASLSRPTDVESLRTYQRELWGSAIGETCAIELSGLPATSFNVPREREAFRQKRIQFIQQKLSDCRPAFVVMYGKGHLKHWKEIAAVVRTSDNVQIVFAPHPVAYGATDQVWIEMGRQLQRSLR
jgi:hypothetical protein